EVYDTGIGIPVDQREDIFREFYQLGNPERDRHKGLGLGLAIARGIAASLDHPLSLSSEVGSGSVFRILVPRSLDAVLDN
ncbi:hybrid sensor histidine kinase/response regulator, partial [Escherichia coli]|nr:hybrid sensor histidine kinase/response regulator [Escherichia coli]